MNKTLNSNNELTKTCNKCQTENSIENNFCTKCGNSSFKTSFSKLETLSNAKKLLEAGKLSKESFEEIKQNVFNKKSNKRFSLSRKTIMRLGITTIIIGLFFLVFKLFNNYSNNVVVPYLKLNGKYIIVESENMKPIDTCEYDNCKLLDNGFIVYEIKSKFGFYSKNGIKVVQPIYSSLEYKKNIFIYSKDNLGTDIKYGFLNLNGKEITSNNIGFNQLETFSDKYIKFEKNGKKGLLNYLGEQIIEPKYEDVYVRKDSLNDFFADVKMKEKWGVIDKKGKILIPIKYSTPIKNVINNNFVFNENNSEGVMNLNGKIIVPNQYETCQILENGNIICSANSISRFHDKNMKYLNTVIGRIFYFNNNNNYLIVSNLGTGYYGSERYGLIDFNGKMLTDFKYYYCLHDGNYYEYTMPHIESRIVALYDLFGIVNKYGKEITKIEYNNITPLSVFDKKNNSFIFYKNGYSGIIDDNGKELLKVSGTINYNNNNLTRWV